MQGSMVRIIMGTLARSTPCSACVRPARFCDVGVRTRKRSRSVSYTHLEIHKGYDETKSGYITFTDELGDFMQVDSFTEIVINGTPFTNPSKTVNRETKTDTYEFDGKAKDLLITVQRAGGDNPQKGDIVTVNIPASLIPLSHFKTVDGKLSVDTVKPKMCIRDRHCAEGRHG